MSQFPTLKIGDYTNGFKESCEENREIKQIK